MGNPSKVTRGCQTKPILRLAKIVALRIKPLRLQESILEYGDAQLDLTKQVALVDPHQVAALGYALLLARKQLSTISLSPSDLADAICKLIDKIGSISFPGMQTARSF